MGRAWKRVFPEAEIILAPIADGGEGMCEMVESALGGRWVTCAATDPEGRRIRARYLWVPRKKWAFVESSEASGLRHVTARSRGILYRNTRGTGELMRHAAELGAERIYVGLGGSATNDGGCGMAAALGWRFLDARGRCLVEPHPVGLEKLARVEPPTDRAHWPEVIALSDVDHPLLGRHGCSRVFGPQKGASPAQVERLEKILCHVAGVVEQGKKRKFSQAGGAGAAGGLGFGLMTFCGARVRPGFEELWKTAGLAAHLEAADVVLTGEGRIDRTSLRGKGPGELARKAHQLGKPVIVFYGACEGSLRVARHFPVRIPLVNGVCSLDDALRNAPRLLDEAVDRAARCIKIGDKIL